MKKIIKGKQYDTEKARFIGCDEGGEGISGWSEELYQKRTGELFLYAVGGAMTHYAVATGDNNWKGGAKIIPLSYDKAREWAEAHLSADTYGEIFDLPNEDAADVTISAILPATLIARARQRAQEQRTTLTAIIETALQQYV